MDSLDFAIGALFLSDCCEELARISAGHEESPRHAIRLITLSAKSFRSTSEMMLLEEEPMPNHILKLMEACRSRLEAAALVVMEMLGLNERAGDSDAESEFYYNSDGYPVRASRRKRHNPAQGLMNTGTQLERAADLLRNEVEQVFLRRQGHSDGDRRGRLLPEQDKRVKESVRDGCLSQIKKLRRNLFLQLRLSGRDGIEASRLLNSLLDSVERVWNKEPMPNSDSAEGRNLQHVSEHYGSLCVGRIRIGEGPFVDVLVQINDLADGAYVSSGTAELAGMEGATLPESGKGNPSVIIEWSRSRYSKLYAMPFDIEFGSGKYSSCCFPTLSVGLQTLCANNPFVRADDSLALYMYKIGAHVHRDGRPLKFSFAKPPTLSSLPRPREVDPRHEDERRGAGHEIRRSRSQRRSHFQDPIRSA